MFNYYSIKGGYSLFCIRGRNFSASLISVFFGKIQQASITSSLFLLFSLLIDSHLFYFYFVMGPPSPKRSRKSKPSCDPSNHNSKYNQLWEREFTFLKPSQRGINHAYCSLCKRDFSVAHGAVGDVKNHVSTKMHKANKEAMKGSTSMASYFSVASDMNEKVNNIIYLFVAIGKNNYYYHCY